MSYIDDTLMKNERVLYHTKPHYIIFTWPIIWLCLTLILFIFGPNIIGLSYTAPSIAFVPALPIYALLALAALALTIVSAITALINYQSSEYGITNKRVLVKVGFIRRTAMEIYLQKIESVKVYQSVSGRIFNYGSITISGTGGSKDPFYNIPAPLEFRKRVQEQIETSQELEPRSIS